MVDVHWANTQVKGWFAYLVLLVHFQGQLGLPRAPLVLLGHTRPLQGWQRVVVALQAPSRLLLVSQARYVLHVQRGSMG